MFTSAEMYFRGPIWAALGALSVVTALVAILSDHFWIWLCVSLGFLVVASFLTFHRDRLTALERAESLPSKIDDLHRDGIKLLAELSKPVEPQRSDDGKSWSVNFDAPPERWEKAEKFDERIRSLFIGTSPALLSDYARGFNDYRRKAREREEAQAPDPEEDARPDAVKLREFTEHMHLKPARVVEASLEGLSFARYRVKQL